MVEIPEKLAEQAMLTAGQAVEWAANGVHSLSFVKKTIADGLLEIEDGIAKKNAEEKHLHDERRRAELGDLEAQHFLGMVSKDRAEAAKWLQLAAEQGDRFSMQHLGHLLLNGDGIEKNIAEGYFWLLLSVSTYSLKSTKQERARMSVERRELQLIANCLTEDERQGIEERCQGWLDAHKLTKCFDPKV
jgi:TPR repeat protein